MINLEASTTGNYAGGSGFATLSVSLSASVSIHPHPYNFKLAPDRGSDPNPTADNANCVLICLYVWKSTSGDLLGINMDSRVYEHLNALGPEVPLVPAQGRTRTEHDFSLPCRPSILGGVNLK